MAKRTNAAAYALIAPSLFGVVAFMVFPVLVVLWLSFQKWDLLGPVTGAGLQNYAEVFSDPAVWNSLKVSLLFVAIVIPLQVGLGLGAATLLTRNLPGSSFFRTVYVVPWVCAPLALGVLWKWIFATSDGALNALLSPFLDEPVEWLSDPRFALPAVAAVTVWSQVGYVALFFMAGLTGIPGSTIEAARLDGASERQIFWRIKLPLLAPTLFFVTVTGIIASFQVFDTVYALAPQGGPQGTTDVVAGRIYDEAFRSFELGRASVLALALLVVLVLFTLAQQRFFAKRVTYEAE